MHAVVTCLCRRPRGDGRRWPPRVWWPSSMSWEERKMTHRRTVQERVHDQAEHRRGAYDRSVPPSGLPRDRVLGF